MKVNNEKTEKGQAFLTIEMEPDEVAESLEKSYHRLVKKTNVPGFRKGKAPRTVLERHIGRESLFDDTLNILIPDAYEKALKEQKITAIAQPHVEVTQTDPLVFKVTVPLPPVVKVGDYHHIQVEQEKPAELTDDNVTAVIEQLRHQQATWEPVERPVDYDDLVVFDIQSSIDDKPFLNQKGAQFQVLHDYSFPAPGFAEQLIGMKKDEEKNFKLNLPSDYPNKELAGKEAVFNIRVNEIKQERLPELNDDFAKAINPEFATLESLRERVTADLKLRAEEKARMEFEERVIQAVVDLSETEFPPVLVDTELSRMLNQRFQKGKAELEEYLRNVNKTDEQLIEEIKPLATKRVIRSLVLGKIVEEEKIEANDSEIDAEMEKTKIEGENKEELQKLFSTPEFRQSIKEILITRKTIGRLVEIARGANANP